MKGLQITCVYFSNGQCYCIAIISEVQWLIDSKTYVPIFDLRFGKINKNKYWERGKVGAVRNWKCFAVFPLFSNLSKRHAGRLNIISSVLNSIHDVQLTARQRILWKTFFFVVSWVKFQNYFDANETKCQ